MKKLIFLLLFITSIANAQDDQAIVDVGVGMGNSDGTRMLTLGIQEDLWGALKQRAVVGGWIDNSGNGHNGSPLVSGQLGFEVNNNGLVIGVFTGPAIVFIPDTLLGGPFQFMSDIHLGIQDLSSNYIGVMYRHISSAGIESPNIGRDIIGLEIRF